MAATLNPSRTPTVAPPAAPPAPPKAPPRAPDLPALRRVPTSHLARNVGRFLLLILILTPFILLFVPWQQSCSARGRVIAFNPDERQQAVEAPIDGRIQRILVREGDRVKGPRQIPATEPGGAPVTVPGDLLVKIQDPNPNFMQLLLSQRETVVERQKAARERQTSFDRQMSSEQAAKEAATTAFNERIRIARDRYAAQEALVERARANFQQAKAVFDVEKRLRPQGLTSEIAYINAQQNLRDREAALIAAQEQANASQKEIDAIKADLDRVRNEIDARISLITALWQGVRAELASADRDLADIDVRIGRQATQDVTAPCDGVVFRVLANSSSGGTLVKVGDPLLIIVPEIPTEQDRVVELFMDGNDAPLVTEMWKAQVLELARQQAHEKGLPSHGPELEAIYREMISSQQLTRIPVRLQFEGYPAIQWVGWPSVAVGTFGGVVAFVDSHDDGLGRFRILVRPDPVEEKSNPWPSGFSLRQGLRAQGWVQLNQVSLGWEMWRRLNGFPPVVATKDPEKQTKETKATKIKVPK